MKFKVLKSVLLAGLQRVQNVVGVRSTLPILANVLITADGESLTLATTDLDVSVRCSIKADIIKKGATTLPVRRFASIIRELPESEIEIIVDDKDTASIQCQSSFFRMVGLSHEEFPEIPKPDGGYAYHLQEQGFREMLQKTAYAASADETRYVLNGVLLNFAGDKLTMVATDGRRLALAEQEVEFPKEAETEMILPTKAVSELLHSLGNEGELRIHARKNQAIFEFGNVMIASKLIDGTYPNYRQVIPAECRQRVTIEREMLLTALRRVALLTVEAMSPTRLTFADNQLVVATNTPDIGEAKETLPIKYSGDSLTVAFNAEYMMAPLKVLAQDQVYVELIDEISPGVIKCDSPFLYVLMPMRVS